MSLSKEKTRLLRTTGIQMKKSNTLNSKSLHRHQNQYATLLRICARTARILTLPIHFFKHMHFTNHIQSGFQVHFPCT